MKILFLTLLFVACASKEKKKCLDTDWYEVGVKDAMSGLISLKHKEYNKECLKEDVSINKAAYISGFENGLERYCSYKNGYIRGQDKLPPHPMCKSINSLFENGYIEGKRSPKK